MPPPFGPSHDTQVISGLQTGSKTLCQVLERTDVREREGGAVHLLPNGAIVHFAGVVIPRARPIIKLVRVIRHLLLSSSLGRTKEPARTKSIQ